MSLAEGGRAQVSKREAGQEQEPPAGRRWVLKDPARLRVLRTETLAAAEEETLANLNQALMETPGRDRDEDETVKMSASEREAVVARRVANTDISESAPAVVDVGEAANTDFAEQDTDKPETVQQKERTSRRDPAAGQAILDRMRQERELGDIDKDNIRARWDRLARDRRENVLHERKKQEVDPAIGKAYFERIGIEKPAGDDELWTGEIAQEIPVKSRAAMRLEAAEARRQEVLANARRSREERRAARDREVEEQARQEREWREYLSDVGRDVLRLDQADFWIQMEQVLPQMRMNNGKEAFVHLHPADRQKKRSYLHRLQTYAMRRRRDNPGIRDAAIRKEIQEHASAMKQKAIETAQSLQYFLDNGYEGYLDGITLSIDPDINDIDRRSIDHKSPKRGTYRFRRLADSRFEMRKVRGTEEAPQYSPISKDDLRHIIQWNIDDLARRYGEDIVDYIGEDPLIQMNGNR